MSWNPIDEPVDYFILAGQRSPGTAVVEGASTPRRWDERRGYALSGATIVFRGVMLAHFKIYVYLCTTEDWNAWNDFMPLVARPPYGERPRALEIWHPFLEQHGIRAVGVEDLKQPVESEPGIWKIEIDLVEYRRPEIALAVPEGAQTRAVDPVDQEIERLTAQVEDLAG